LYGKLLDLTVSVEKKYILLLCILEACTSVIYIYVCVCVFLSQGHSEINPPHHTYSLFMLDLVMMRCMLIGL